MSAAAETPDFQMRFDTQNYNLAFEGMFFCVFVLIFTSKTGATCTSKQRIRKYSGVNLLHPVVTEHANR